MKTSNTTEDNLHILIVDDEPIVRLDLKAMLKVQGYDVIGEAGDGLTAVDLCREYHPDVVLMDVKMPVFDGLTAADTILKEKLADCVILLTAFNDAAIIDQARTIGVTGYLVKPIDQKSLKPTIEVAHAQSLRLAESRDETTNAYKKLEEQKQPDIYLGLYHQFPQLSQYVPQFPCAEAEPEILCRKQREGCF